VLQREWDVEQVINAQICDFYSVKYYKHFIKQFIDHFYKYEIHLQSKGSVYLNIFVRLL